MCSFPPVRLTSHFSNKATSFLLCHVPAPLKVSKKNIQFGSLFLLHKIFFLQIAKAKKMERQPKLNSWIFIPFFQNTLLFSPCGQWANPLLVGALRSPGKKTSSRKKKKQKKILVRRRVRISMAPLSDDVSPTLGGRNKRGVNSPGNFCARHLLRWGVCVHRLLLHLRDPTMDNRHTVRDAQAGETCSCVRV